MVLSSALVGILSYVMYARPDASPTGPMYRPMTFRAAPYVGPYIPSLPSMWIIDQDDRKEVS